MTASVFAVPVFFVVFRETIETVLIVSILLAWLKQTLDGPNANMQTYKKLVKQVWIGVGLGLGICLIVGAAIIAVFYTKGRDAWASTEYYYEGSFALLASLMIGYLGGALLRVAKLQDKWRVKLATALESQPVTAGGKWGAFKRWAEKYAMFIVPFITVLREGIEAIVFIAGVSFTSPATAVPLAVVMGLIAGSAVGYLVYKGGASSKLQLFLIISTCLLYLIGAGLFSRSIWYFQAQDWNNAVGSDAAELGAGPGSYDIDQSVWHLNYGNPELNGGGGWGIFNAIFGWTNSATYGSVIGYNLYWLCVIIGFVSLRYKEVKGHWPLMKSKVEKEETKTHRSEDSNSPASSGIFEKTSTDKKAVDETVHNMPSKTIEG